MLPAGSFDDRPVNSMMLVPTTSMAGMLAMREQPRGLARADPGARRTWRAKDIGIIVLLRALIG